MDNQGRQAKDRRTTLGLNRMSTTGQSFLLDPDSRTGIVQELQLRLKAEQQKRRELLLRSSNNTSQKTDGEFVLAQPLATPLSTEHVASFDSNVPPPEYASSTTVTDPPPETDIDAPLSEQAPPQSTVPDASEPTAPSAIVIPPLLQDAPIQSNDTQPDSLMPAPQQEVTQEVIQEVTDVTETEPELSYLLVKRDEETPMAPDGRDRTAYAPPSSTSQDTLILKEARAQTGERIRSISMRQRDSQQEAKVASVKKAAGETQDSMPVTLDAIEHATGMDGEKPGNSSYPRPIFDKPTASQNLGRTSEGSSGSRSLDGTNEQLKRRSVRSVDTPIPDVPMPDSGHPANSFSSRPAAAAQKPAQQRTAPPCLQCLMRSLQDSGLLGDCWTEALIELEEAFAIKHLADYAVGRSGAPAGGESLKKLPLPVVSSGEASSPTPTSQTDTSKWKALERLCYLRNSLQTCSHSDS